MFDDKNTILNSGLEKAKNLEEENNFQEAFSIYDNLLIQYPEDKNTIFARGLLYKKTGLMKQALLSFNRLLQLGAIEHVALFNIAETLKMMKEYDKAIIYYVKAIHRKKDEVALYHSACDLMIRNNHINDAKNLVALGFETLPDNPDLLSIKGKILAYEKKYTEAEKEYGKAIKSIDKSIAKNYILNDYAKIKEELGEFEEAINIISKSKKEEKKLLSSKGISSNFIDEFITISSKMEVSKDWQGKITSDNKSPIFVVGFPRSGTTLVEQILYSHPNLSVSDEANILPNMVFNLSKILKQNIEYPDGLNYITKDKILKWRSEYISRMAKIIPDFDSNLRIVDKNPMSFVYFLAIKRFFPEAPIVMIIRDPRDVVISCLFQNFTPNISNIHFYSIEDCTKYYSDSMNLYLKYRDSLNLNILQVSYEDLCNDSEKNIRKIITHINEGWHDDILQYYNNDHRYISNPSFDNVTKEINKDAICKWKNYEKHLDKVLPTLEPFIKEFGYKI